MDKRLPDVGARIREARERRGLTLYAISSATKISTTALKAIERNDIASLPGRLYTRGHVAAYAAEVGLNPNETAAEFIAQFEATASEDHPPLAVSVKPLAPEKSSTPAVPATQPTQSASAFLDLGEKRPSMVIVGLVAALAIGIAILVYGMFAAPSTGEEPATPAADDTAVEPVASALGTVDAAPATGEAPVMRMEIIPKGPCWVSIRADGQIAVFRVMRPGEREVVDANDSLLINVGEAGNFEYRINGTAGRPLGRPGNVVTTRITAENFRTYLEGANSGAQ